ncbi:MAG: DNA-(apurinic or apyrimidinic site) lyase [Chthonomonadaceae bacterium]|nr:DNA-(apurinic or apyrimidinic site) lyase [Chthonomonadaceae bacterium]
MATLMTPKTPFDIEAAMPLIAAAIAPFPKAGLFTLHDEGHTTLFEQLVACILSIRTLDEVMIPVSRQLFAIARTPQQVADLPLDRLKTLIGSVAFGETKAVNIQTIARRAVTEFHRDLPCDMDQLLTLPGVGPKCAGLALAIACGQPHIGVDVHVHRIVNRWGYVATKTPEGSLEVLKAKLPQSLWIDMNRLGMPFGKFICTSNRPLCSTCPLLTMCPQIGVTTTR